jgi:DNA invertase Pin-like site-specific DNA recombinase
MENQKNAVIYARYSSAGQTEQSIEGQIRVCKEYAKTNGYNVIGEYIDRAKTGTNDNRPQFQEMIADASKKEFQYIIVYKVDRFARNQYDSVVYKHKLLNDYGIKVVSATEAISDTNEGRLVETLLEYMAGMYSNDLRQKVTRGLKESVIKGNTIGSKPPYGYRVVDKKLVIDEKEAEVMRFIFREYTNGKSKKEIFTALEQKGYKTPNGRKFISTSFQDNLKNTKYIGVYEQFGVRNENYCPAMIDKDTFDKVQKLLKANMNKRAKMDFLLTGKVFCAKCGASIFGVSGTARSGFTHGYYCCSTDKRNTPAT